MEDSAAIQLRVLEVIFEVLANFAAAQAPSLGVGKTHHADALRFRLAAARITHGSESNDFLEHFDRVASGLLARFTA